MKSADYLLHNTVFLSWVFTDSWCGSSVQVDNKKHIWSGVFSVCFWLMTGKAFLSPRSVLSWCNAEAQSRKEKHWRHIQCPFHTFSPPVLTNTCVAEPNTSFVPTGWPVCPHVSTCVSPCISVRFDSSVRWRASCDGSPAGQPQTVASGWFTDDSCRRITLHLLSHRRPSLLLSKSSTV